ncbi:MAG: hypothetical protein AMXMBFR64_35940 [Myxococcales bacterium]
MSANAPPRTEDAPDPLSLRAAARVWGRIGLLSFGGPAGQIALMYEELVVRRRWIDEARFLHALNYCMLLPGPEAQQLATYIGWLLHRTPGGLVAGLLFVLPGFVAMMGLAALYAAFGTLPAIAALFYGLKAAVLAVVAEAVLRIGRRAIRTRAMGAIAVAAFVAIFFFGVPFPLIVLGAGLTGLAGGALAPGAFPAGAAAGPAAHGACLLDRLEAAGALAHTRPSVPRALRVLVVCLALWVLPVAVLAGVLGTGSVFVTEGLFFSQAAVVTFGGAYAVLAWIAQQAVEVHGWLKPGEMLDGLGLAETTPGPLIMVVQFVGFLGAWRHPGLLPPGLAGVIGACVTVWVTFVPCFLWIFAGAPWVEALRGHRPLRVALSAITAAVVGVILNLALWFGLHVVFARVGVQHVGPVRLLVPEWGTVDPAAAVLTAAALVAMLRYRVGLPATLAACAALGAAWRLVGA